MKTNRDRKLFLKERNRYLGSEIEKKGLESKYLELCMSISKKHIWLSSISDEEWDMMLPKEKDKNIVTYYTLLRLEYKEMMKEERKHTASDSLNEWLDSPWVKLAIGVMTTIPFIAWLINIWGEGLFFGSHNQRKEHEEIDISELTSLHVD